VRILVLGGTQFVGRALVETLAGRGHELLVVHRGEHEPTPWIDVGHLHSERRDLPRRRDRLDEFAADVVVDTSALTRSDAEIGASIVGAGARVVVLSSMDVYQAYGDLLAGIGTQAVPLSEAAPVRESRYPYRGRYDGMDDYEKLDVEDVYRSVRATICRLPAVYGPHDEQRREDFVLRRVRAGRSEIPFGPGNWLWSRMHVNDAAHGIAAAIESDVVENEVLNIGPRQTLTIRQWATVILTAAGSEARLVSVPEHLLPPDLWMTGSLRQHILCDASKARALLGWRDGDQVRSIFESVEWHLANPPEGGETEWAPDDRALER